jgi:hypothetical protein
VTQKLLAKINFFALPAHAFNARAILTAGATNFVLTMFALSPAATMPGICAPMTVIARAV